MNNKNCDAAFILIRSKGFPIPERCIHITSGTLTLNNQTTRPRWKRFSSWNIDDRKRQMIQPLSRCSRWWNPNSSPKSIWRHGGAEDKPPSHLLPEGWPWGKVLQTETCHQTSCEEKLLPTACYASNGTYIQVLKWFLLVGQRLPQEINCYLIVTQPFSSGCWWSINSILNSIYISSAFLLNHHCYP